MDTIQAGWVSFGLAMASTTTIQAATIFVNGSCGNNSWTGAQSTCAAPSGPKATIQAAIVAAVNGDVVSVAPGTYHEVINLLGKAITLRSEDGAKSTVIDGTGLVGAVVRIASGENADTVIDGFTLTHGTGELDVVYRVGGGIYTTSSPTIQHCVIQDNHVDWGAGMMIWGGSPTVRNCAFVNNSATQLAGGIAKEGAAPMLIEGCTFENNSAATRAGGALLNGAVTMRSCSFSANHAENGGGLAILSHGVTIEQCSFVGNVAEVTGGACWLVPTGLITFEACEFVANQSVEGGAFAALSASPWPSELTFIECSFDANVATVGGAGALDDFDAVSLVACDLSKNLASIRGGAIHIIQSSPTIQDCTFQSNRTDFSFGEGGAVYSADGSDPSIEGCAFEANEAGTGGAVMSFYNSSPSITDCSFESNLARFGGAAAGFAGGTVTCENANMTGNAASSDGGAVWLRQCEGSFSNCSLSANWAESGGGIRARDSRLFLGASTLTTNTGYLYGGGLYGSDGSTLELVDCDFEQNIAENQSGGGILWTGSAPDDPPLSITNCDFVANVGAGPAISLGASCSADIHGCTVTGNNNSTGASGGAVSGGNVNFTDTYFAGNFGSGAYSFGGIYTFTDCQINDDVTTTGSMFVRDCNLHGGGVATWNNGSAVIERCSLLGSVAYQFGGSLQIVDSTFTNSGQQAIRIDGHATISNCQITGGQIGILVYDTDSPALITNCVIANCTTGVYRSSSDVARFSNCTIANCTTAINDFGFGPSGRFRFNNCIIQGAVTTNGAGLRINHSDVVNGWSGAGIGNISADPLFVNAPLGDYRLQPNSPCIDAGNNWGVAPDALDLDDDNDRLELTPVDLARDPRFVQTTLTSPGCGVPVTIDIGAFEHQIGVQDTPIFGDATGDGEVGSDDLITVILQWGLCSGCCLADFDIDADVDIDDLITVILHWS